MSAFALDGNRLNRAQAVKLTCRVAGYFDLSVDPQWL
jgi:hypothetical protein